MPTDQSQLLKIEGLREFRRELKRLDQNFIDDLKDAHHEAASYVVEKARGRAGTAQQRKAAQSLKASRTAAQAQLTYGGSGYAFALGAEFGSNRYRQFPPHLGRIGYFLYPTIRDEGDEILRIYGDALGKITRAAFPD